MSYRQEEKRPTIRSFPDALAHALETHFELLANPHTNRISIDLLIAALHDPARPTPSLELRALTEIRDEYPTDRNYKVHDLVSRLASKVEGYRVCEQVMGNWWESYHYVSGNAEQSTLLPLVDCLNASTKREKEGYDKYPANLRTALWKRSSLIQTVVSHHARPE